MSASATFVVPPGKPFKLADVDPADTGPFKDKADAADPTKANLAKLDELQEKFYADGRRALLVVFQGLDTSGKDGAIEHVFAGVDPQGVQVTSFKAPCGHELRHDYLWRVHAATPTLGMIGIWNRSHYESVTAERVLNLVDDARVEQRFEHINAFEQMLTDEATTVLKFYLHLSKAEQKKRLLARQADPAKHWKFNPGDLDTRAKWAQYAKVYDRALAATSTAAAPWHVVPADRKWYRNWAVSEALVRTIERLGPKWPKSRVDPATFVVR